MTVATAVQLYQSLLPEPEASLLAGIVFGAKTSLDPAITQLFITTGSIHIMALSGMNITILETLVAATLLRLLSRKITSLLTIIIIMGFVLFVGVSASVVRAAIMGFLALIATVFGKQKSSLWFLTITAFGMVALHSEYLSDIGFLLSVAATLGIILFQKPLTQKRSWEEKVPRAFKSILAFVRDELGTTLAAQVFTVPIIMVSFHQVSLVAPLTNLLIGWTIVPVTVLGLLIFGLGLLYAPIAQVLVWFGYLLLHYILGVVSWLASVPLASYTW